MTCVWNGNLHGKRVDRSDKHSQKQFLHLDHWIQILKSRECNKHIWFVVRLRTGPVAASLSRLIHLLWKTVAASHSAPTTCAQLHSQLQNNSTFHLWRRHVQKAHAHRSKDMHHFSLTNSLDPSSMIWTTLHQYFQIPIKTQKTRNLASFSDSTHLTYITKMLHHGCHSLLAIC